MADKKEAVKVDASEKDELYGGNPMVYADALENMKNVRKLIKDRLKTVEQNADIITDATATEKVRLQGTEETKAPDLKPYTETIDVKDRAELSTLVEKAKKDKKVFKIGRSMKEGFRYTFLLEEMEPMKEAAGHKVGDTVKIIMMAGEPKYTGKIGKITKIDDAGQLHGTWGGLALIPGEDQFEILDVVNEKKMEEEHAEEVREVKHGKKHMREYVNEAVEDWGTEIVTFEQAKEHCKDMKWDITDEKLFNTYVDRGFKLFVKGEGADKKLTYVKDGLVTKVVDAQDQLVMVENIMGAKMMPMMEEGGEEHHHEEEPKQDEGEYDQEGDMAKSDLQIMADAALELHGMLQDEENLPEWVQAKITLASDYIDTARDYMKAKKAGQDFPEPVEGEEEAVLEPVEEAKEMEEVLVEPKKGETEQEYVSRFMGSKQANKDFPNQKQRAAVAYSKFRGKKEELVDIPEPQNIQQSRFFAGDDGDVEAHIFTDSEGIEDFDLKWDDAKGGYVLTWEVQLDESKKKEEVKPEVKKEEGKKPLEEKKLKEETKIITELGDFEPWSGAVSTWDLIVGANKVDALDFLLEDLYPEGIGQTELNDLLWFEADWVLDMLGISRDEVVKDEEEPAGEREEKSEVEGEEGEEEDFMSMLNDLDEEPVVVVDEKELEEAKHHKEKHAEEKEEKHEAMEDKSVFKEVQDFIAKVAKK